MDASTLAAKAQPLSDIEHAMLLSLMAKQHCILETADAAVDQLEEEIKAVRLPSYFLKTHHHPRPEEDGVYSWLIRW